jgi:hypothetical protein
MKWYWAILLTIVILSGLVALLQIGHSEAEWFVHFVVAIFAVWAAGKSASVGWGIFVLLLWPIGFPCFLISQYGRPRNTES